MDSAPRQSTGASWGVAAKGGEALVQLQTHGRALVAPEDFRVVVDHVWDERVRLRRAWSTECVEQNSLSAPGSSELRVVSVLNGRATATALGRTHLLPAGSMIVFSGGLEYQLTFPTPTARLEVSVDLRQDVDQFHVLRGLDAGLAAPLVTVAASLIEQRMSPGDPRWRYGSSALLTLARGMTQARHSADNPFLQALDLIQEEAGDPTLTVARVAAYLRVSPRTLHRYFSMQGTSVSAELTRMRVERARQALHSGGVAPRDAARASGFLSVRAMRDALRRLDGQEHLSA